MTPDFGSLLIVEDNEANRDLLCRRLARQGYAVAAAESGNQAFEFVGQQKVDLVLLDIMMPGIGGLAVLKRLRETHSPTELPVIMAYTQDLDEKYR